MEIKYKGASLTLDGQTASKLWAQILNSIKEDSGLETRTVRAYKKRKGRRKVNRAKHNIYWTEAESLQIDRRSAELLQLGITQRATRAKIIAKELGGTRSYYAIQQRIRLAEQPKQAELGTIN